MFLTSFGCTVLKMHDFQDIKQTDNFGLIPPDL